ncbi:MAG TPA: TIGR02265 family protein [Thermoanaerobaculia bacterium]|nr:TIGR02265 family protein [Thermoanaerobaculia bacterium]
MKVKGAVLLSRAAFVKKQFGEQAWKDVLAAVSADDGTSLAGLLASGWYPFEIGQRLDDAIVRVIGKGARTVFENLGAASARENLTTVHKMFVRGQSPQGFMAKAPMIYGFYYDTGKRTYEPTGPSSGVVTTFDAGSYSAVDCLTVIGWHKEALAMCGATNVAVQETACRARGDAVCRYEFRWRFGAAS